MDQKLDDLIRKVDGLATEVRLLRMRLKATPPPPPTMPLPSRWPMRRPKIRRKVH